MGEAALKHADETWVYAFGGGTADGDATMKNLLGGKGANLAEMAKLGLPVPPGFTISTAVCTAYYELEREYPATLAAQVDEALADLEAKSGKGFGDPENPLLVSVRSGAAVSMPGMMDTILNLGINDRAVEGLAAQSGSRRFAFDSYRRFLQMFGNVVMGIDGDHFEHRLDALKKEKGVAQDTELTAEDLEQLVQDFKGIFKEQAGEAFPDSPDEQLKKAVNAVFGSWDNDRAKTYRRLNRIPDEWGTAVNVQSMVFGNMGDDCATGVAFTRDPSTGERRFFGEFLVNAQGEDVVAGIRTPHPISKENAGDSGLTSMEEEMPELYRQLVDIYQKLEHHYRDMQDLEFTVEKGELFLLQTRNGKRTGFASIRIACDMVEEGLIDEQEALRRVEPTAITQLLAPVFNLEKKQHALDEGRLLTKGLNAGPGAATGRIMLSADKAVEMAQKGPVVLVRVETSPEDLAGMDAAQGILTARGGMTSHAAVVARGMGKPCVVGCGELEVDYRKGTVTVNGRTLNEGDFISIDGTTGEVIQGEVETMPSEVIQILIQGKGRVEDSLICRNFSRLVGWAEKGKRLGVRTNADTPHDAAVARSLGAKGIGLCRTEHMFFDEDRIMAVREMIVAETTAAREKALAKILPMQRSDFEGIFEAMDSLPVTVRLLDPPLHEFLPHEHDAQQELAESLGITLDALQQRIESLSEMNPMLGHRGCRLGITYPEIYRMQVRAIFEAAVNCKKKGVNAVPEVMIPLIGFKAELSYLKELLVEEIEAVFAEAGQRVDYLMGTMIEVPRAAVTADEIAEVAEFFSFGTNDLTQMGLGFSRDDAGVFISDYLGKRIFPQDPFQSIDVKGVGELVKIAVEKGRATNSKLKLGICGEHGGDPDSVHFCHGVGLDYVSCSPYRVPVAILAAAQASLG